MIAILAGLGGMLGWGLADFFAKKTIDEIGDMVSLVWAHIFGTLTLFLIVLYRFMTSDAISVPGGSSIWFLLVLFGVLQAIVYLLLYLGFGKGQVSLLSPIFSSFAGITALFSILVFGELVTPQLLLALAIIFGGIILINLDLKSLKSKRINFVKVPGLKEIAVATLLAAIWTISWDRFIGGQDWLVYTFLMYLFMTVILFLIAKVKRIKLSFGKKHIWKFLILIGFTETLAYLAISLGYSHTSHTSVIALLSGAFSLPVIILARIFLKERTTAIQAAGSIIIILGIMLLALYN